MLERRRPAPESVRRERPVREAELVELPDEGLDLEATLDELERRYLQRALDRTRGVQTKAAELLKMTFRQFRYKLQKHSMGASAVAEHDARPRSSHGSSSDSEAATASLRLIANPEHHTCRERIRPLWQCRVTSSAMDASAIFGVSARRIEAGNYRCNLQRARSVAERAASGE